MNSHYLAMAVLAFILIQTNADKGSDKENRTAQCQTPVDIAFVVDASGSISSRNYQLQKDFIKRVMELNYLSRDGAHAGVVLFSQTSSTAIKLNEYYNITEFNEGVQRLPHEYSITRIDKGLKTAYDQLFTKSYGSRYNVPKVLFLLTDGKQTRSGDFIEPTIAVLPLHDLGVKIIAIGIGSGVERSELEQLAGNKQSVFMARNFKQLLDVDFLENFDFACHPDKLSLPTSSPITQVTQPKIATTPFANVLDYFVALDITNNHNRNVTFKYTQSGEQKDFVVIPKSQYLFDVKISSTTYPLPFVFKAYDTETGKLIQLRDRDKLLVIPRTTKLFENIVLEPEEAEAFINLDVENKIEESIVLIWQQNGRRKLLTVPGKVKIAKEIIFDRSKGISPVDFTAKTVAKNLPVKLNGKREVMFTPSIIKTSRSLVLEKAVQDFYVIFDIVNEASGPIAVEWKQNGNTAVIEVDYKKTRSREIAFKDQLKAPSIQLRSYLLDSKEPVTLNGKGSLPLRAQPSKAKQRVVASKKYYIDLRVKNEVAEDAIITWTKNGVSKSLGVAKGSSSSKDLVFSGTTAKESIRFTAKTASTDLPVKINEQDFFYITPTSTKKETKATLMKKYFLSIDFINKATGDIVVEWESKKGKQLLEIQKSTTSRQEIEQTGIDANKPLRFNAIMKENKEAVLLNGKISVSFTPTPSKEVRQVVASKDYFLDVEFKNQAAGDIVVNWKENGQDKSIEVKQGATNKQEIVVNGANANTPIQFNAVTKGTNEPVKLNGEDSVSFTPTPSKEVRQVVASKDYFLDVEFKNQAAGDIVVNWKENGQGKSIEVKQGATNKQEIVVNGANANTPIQFNAVTKGTNEPVKLNGEDSVSFTPTPSKEVRQVVASKDYFLDVEFKNQAAGDIVVNWRENGQDKSMEVKQGATNKQEIVVNGANANTPIQFNAVMKGTNEPVKLNGEDSVSFTPTPSKEVRQVVASKDYFLDVEFKNQAAGDIVVNWKENGQDKSIEVKQGATNKQEIVVKGANSNTPIQFNAVTKGTNEPVKLNGEDSVSFTPTPSKEVRQVVASKDYFLDVEFKNQAAGDIVVNWKENGQDKSIEVKQGATNKQEIVVNGANANTPIQFNAVTKGTNEPVKLNGEDSVSFTPTPSKEVRQVVASKDYFLDVEFKNQAAGDIVVNWKENGQDKSIEVKQGATNKQEIVVNGANANTPIQFNAVTKGTNEPVKLNGEDSVSFTPTPSKEVRQVVASKDYFLDVEFKNQAAGDIVVKWNEDGQDKSIEVKQGATNKHEIVVNGANANTPIQFNAVTKGTNEPVKLNGEDSVSFTPTPSKEVRQVVASKDYFLEVEFKNQAAGDIVVNWKENGQGKSIEVKQGATNKQEIVVNGANANTPIQFNAVTKGTNEPVKLNGEDSVSFTPTPSKEVRQVVASKDYFLDVEFKNQAAGDIVVNWKENGHDKSMEVKQGATNKQEIVVNGANANTPIQFNAVMKGTNEPVKLNGEDSVSFTPTPSKEVRQVVASKDYFLDVEFKNQAAGDIVVNWKENGQDKSIEVKQGATNKQEIVVNGANANTPIQFNAVAKGTNEPVKLDGKDSVSFTPTPSKEVKKAVATTPGPLFFINLKAVNKFDHSIVVVWEEKSSPQNLIVPAKSEIKKEIILRSSERNNPIQFVAYIEDTKEQIKLNNSDSVQLMPSTTKIERTVVADAADIYTLEIINKASGIVNVNMLLGDESTEIQVPFQGLKKVRVQLNKATSLKLSGINSKTKRPVQLNGLLTLPVGEDLSESGSKVIRVVAKDKLCSLKVDIAFVLDASGSILPKQYKLQKEFVSKVAAANNISRNGVHVGVVLFSHSSSAPIKLSDFYTATSLASGVTKLKHESSITRIDRGLKTAYDKLLTKSYGARDDVPKVLFLITDGTQTRRYNFIEPRIVSMPLKRSGVYMKAIGIGRGADRKELEIITGNKESVYMIKYFNQLLEEKFIDNFNFNCKENNLESPAVLPDPVISAAPIKFGPTVDYFVALNVQNNRKKNVILKWKEDGINKQREIAKESSENININYRKNFYPDPVSFFATEKQNGNPVKLRDRDNLQVIPRKSRIVEKVVLEPESQYAYLYFDIVNKLEEPIVVEWQQNGEKSSLRVPALSTKTKEITFDRSTPGSMSPVPFTAYKENTKTPVGLNDKTILPVLPSITREKKALLVKSKLPDSFINLKVINRRNEDIEVLWKENEVPKFFLVPKQQTREERITFPEMFVAKSISFIGKTTGKNEQNVVKLNDKEINTFKTTLDGDKINELISTVQPMKITAEFMNLASGPIVVSWVDNGVNKTLDIAQGQNVRKTIKKEGEYVSIPITFTARNTITNAPVKLNGATKIEVTPTLEDKVEPIVALDDPDFKDGWDSGAGVKDQRYIVADIMNFASGPIVVSWLENGDQKTVDVEVNQKIQKTIVTKGKNASKPISFTAKNKISNAPVKLNGGSKVEITPTLEKKVEQIVALDDPDFKDGWDSGAGVKDQRYIVADIMNFASGPIVVSWNENGDQKTVDVEVNKKIQKTIVTKGKNASKPISFTAKKKISNAPVKLNGASKVEITPTLEKKVEQIVALDDPDFKDGWDSGAGVKDQRYIVADIMNFASGPIVVSWNENGDQKTVDVEVNKKIQKTIVTKGKNASKPISFTAKNKISNAPVKLNGGSKVEITPTLEKKVEQIVALDDPDFKDGWDSGAGVKDQRYIVADIMNFASGPIVVSWNENGDQKTVDVEVNKKIQKTIVTKGKNASKPISFTAKNKISNAPVKLNGGSKVEITPTLEKKVEQIVALDDPDFKDGWDSGAGVKDQRYIVADIMNLASGPIVVSWLENGDRKTVDVEVNQKIQKTIVTKGRNASKPISFTAINKLSKDRIILNSAVEVELIPTLKKVAQAILALDHPDSKKGTDPDGGTSDIRYIAVNFRNDGSDPIVVSWFENKVEKTLDVQQGGNVQVTVVSQGKDASKPISFTARGKNSNAPVMLNGAEKVEFVPSLDKSVKQAVATDQGKYIIANFRNDASEPIVVSWLANGVVKTIEVAQGENVQQRVVSQGKDASKPISFTARGKNSNDPVLLNGAEKVEFVPSLDKSVKQAVATDQGKYIIANFRNDASEPIVVSWLANGVVKTIEVAQGENVQQRVVSQGKDASKPISFTARGKNSNAPVMLNGAEKVEFVPSLDKSVKQAVATDQRKYIIANFRNDASEPIVVSWLANGVVKTIEVAQGENVQQRVVSQGKDASKPISFTARGKNSNAPVMLNGAEKVEFVPSLDKSVKQAVATDQGKYIIANFRNDASEPIVISWLANGVVKTIEVAQGENVQQRVVSQGKDASKPISFTARGKNSNAPVMLNGAEKVEFVPSLDKSVKQAVATDQGKYIIANFRNDASEPIVVSWLANGVVKTIEVAQGENVQQIVASQGKDASKPISFTARSKNSNAPVMLNGAEKVQFVPSLDKSVKQAVATDQEKYIIANFRNDASGPVVVTWLENGVDQKLNLKKGESVERKIFLQGKDASKRMVFSAMLKDSNAPVSLNGKMTISVMPSLEPTRRDIIASTRYVEVNFINKAAKSTIVQWRERGNDKQVEVAAAAEVRRTIHYDNAGGTVMFAGFYRKGDRKVAVRLNNVLNLALKEDPNHPIIDVIIEKAVPKRRRKLRYLALNIQNKIDEDVTLRFEMLGRAAEFNLPARSSKKHLLETFVDYAVPFVARSDSDGRIVYVNKMKRLLLTPTEDIKWRDVVIKSEKPIEPIKYCATIAVINKASEPIFLDWRIGNSIRQLEPKADNVLRERICIPGLNPMSPIKFTSVTKASRIPLMINGRPAVVAEPNYNSANMKLYISKEESTFVDLKAINKLPNDVSLEWWYGSGMQKLDVPARQQIGKLITLPFDMKSGVEFRAFVKGSRSQPNVNGLKSVVFSPNQLTKQGIEVIIDSMYFLGYDILNDGPKTAVVAWEDEGKTKELTVPPGKRVKDMMSLYRNGIRKPVAFSAREQGSGRVLTLNNLQSVRVKPTLRKRYKFMRINGFRDSGVYYVILEVQNRLREDAIINWKENGIIRSKECGRASTCLIAYELNSQLTKPVPTIFTARSKQSGATLKMDSKDSLAIQPLPYRKIRNARIDYEDVKTHTSLFVSAYGSNMNQEPVIIEYKINGKTERMKLTAFQKRRNELHIKNPNKIQPIIEFKAYDERTKQPFKVNGKASFTYRPVKYNSKIYLMVGEPLVSQGGISELQKAHKCRNRKVDVLFMIDNSGTMLYAFQVAKLFIMKLTDLFDLSLQGTRASVISIAGPTKTSLDIRFSDYYNRTLFHNAVNNTEFQGGKTRIDLALKIASKQAFKPENGGRPGVPKLVFFISDGRQEPKKVNGRYVNLFRESMPLYRMVNNIVSIGVLGERPVDIGALQLISKNEQNVYDPGNMEMIVSDIFVKHIFNKYCHV